MKYRDAHMKPQKTGYIYKLVCDQPNVCYIGSTSHSIHVRLCAHFGNYNLYLKGKQGYVSSFDIVKYDDVDIILLETIKYRNRNELLLKEEEWKNQTPHCVNRNRAYRTEQQRVEQMNRLNKKHNSINNLKKWTCIKCNKTMYARNKYRHLTFNKHINNEFNELKLLQNEMNQKKLERELNIEKYINMEIEIEFCLKL